MLNSLFWLLVIFLIGLSAACFYAQYKITEKYFPGMTILEYVIMSDKIRITPNDRP